MDTQIKCFYSEFTKYIDNGEKILIKNKYSTLYKITKKVLIKNKIQRKFVKNYKHLNEYVNRHNDVYIENCINEFKFDKVNGYDLDYNQKKAIICDEINSLIIAGAGCGKTLTIVGKIHYLIKQKSIKPDEILCISFTNDSCNSLKYKLENTVEVLTFHKLALKIIANYNFRISSIPLDYVIDEYFNSVIYNNHDMIKKVLKILKIKVCANYLVIYRQILSNKLYKSLKKTILTFINLFKAYDYSYSKFIDIYSHKNKDLICIIIDIYTLYHSELSSQKEIDFNDMISLATSHIINNKIDLKYKYIIIDEYQDTSLTRYKLIKAIKDNAGSKLIAVGDDWQSIYRFTGCNLDIFLKFESFFGYTKRLYILNTYRNCQELINVAGAFVQRNKKQVKKQLKSSKHIKKPIKILYESDNILEKLLKYLAEKHIDHIMILGRNNSDINKYLSDNLCIEDNILSYRNNNSKIRYLTIHKSKGLEEECVIIINLYDDLLGMPCKLVSGDLIDTISKKSKYSYDEERRLFYVALTRTKNHVYLIIPKKKASIFVKELIKYNKKYIEYINL